MDQSTPPYYERAISDTEIEALFSKTMQPLFAGQATAHDVMAQVVPLTDAILTRDQQLLAKL